MMPCALRLSEMSQEKKSPIPLLLLLLVVGLYAGYALGSITSQPSDDSEYLAGRISSLEGLVASLQSQLNDMAIRNLTSIDSIPSLNAIYNSSKASIVTITGLVESTSFFVTTYDEILGSGFVINLTGEPLVITNYHVVDGLLNSSITFIDGESYSFSVVGMDKYSDIAVLRPNAPASKLKPLTVASSSGLLVGDSVIAIGNPYGLESTLTVGIVSQLGRGIQTETAGSYTIAGVIQISTPINPGNSGGPLLDSMGRVVGMTTAIISGSQNVGFAVPSDSLLREIVSLTTTGSYQHAYLGMKSLSNSYLISNALSLPVTYGVLVQSVTDGTPADDAGIRGGSFTVGVANSTVSGGGDLIIAIDDKLITTLDDMTSLLESYHPGQAMNVTVIREGSPLTLFVTLGARP